MYLNERLETKFTKSLDWDYKPSTGTFISEDRADFAGGDGNLYRYVKNNPKGYVDPTGEFGIAGFFIGAFSGAIGTIVANPNASMQEVIVSGLISGGLGALGGLGIFKNVYKSLLGALTSLISNLLGQLSQNGGRLECVNVGSLLTSTLGGALAGLGLARSGGGGVLSEILAGLQSATFDAFGAIGFTDGALLGGSSLGSPNCGCN